MDSTEAATRGAPKWPPPQEKPERITFRVTEVLCHRQARSYDPLEVRREAQIGDREPQDFLEDEPLVRGADERTP